MKIYEKTPENRRHEKRYHSETLQDNSFKISYADYKVRWHVIRKFRTLTCLNFLRNKLSKSIITWLSRVRQGRAGSSRIWNIWSFITMFCSMHNALKANRFRDIVFFLIPYMTVVRSFRLRTRFVSVAIRSFLANVIHWQLTMYLC